MKKGPFKLIDSKVVYRNNWIEIREDNVIRPDGTHGIFGVMDYGQGVSILAIDKNKNITLIKEYGYAIEREDLLLPSGGIEEGEEALVAAKRELFEETGLESEEWVSLGIVNPLTMIVKSPFHLFVALNVKKTGTNEENIKTYSYHFDEVLEMVKDGKISHAGTLSTIFKAKLYFEELNKNK